VPSIDLTLSLSKGEVEAPRPPEPSILRQAQDEDFGPAAFRIRNPTMPC
jgi:hypothetical protein